MLRALVALLLLANLAVLRLAQGWLAALPAARTTASASPSGWRAGAARVRAVARAAAAAGAAMAAARSLRRSRAVRPKPTLARPRRRCTAAGAAGHGMGTPRTASRRRAGWSTWAASPTRPRCARWRKSCAARRRLRTADGATRAGAGPRAFTARQRRRCRSCPRRSTGARRAHGARGRAGAATAADAGCACRAPMRRHAGRWRRSACRRAPVPSWPARPPLEREVAADTSAASQSALNPPPALALRWLSPSRETSQAELAHERQAPGPRSDDGLRASEA